MSEPAKLCKDCRYCVPKRRWFRASYKYAMCGRFRTSPVDGSPECFCSSMRFRDEACGPDGKGFEAP